MKKKKFLITGASTYGVDNYGDDAMLATLIQGLKKKYPYSEITFLARHPNKKFDKLFDFKSIKNLDHYNRKKSIGKFFYGMNQKDPTKHLEIISKKIAESDVVIIGGNLFMEIFPNSFLKGISSYTSLITTISRFFNKPVVLYGVNVVNKIKQKTTKDHAKFVLGVAKKITVRENSAKKLLLGLGTSGRKIKVLGDPAFGLNFSNNKNKAYKILSKCKINIKKNEKIIGVCLREEYWKIGNKELQRKRFIKIAKILDSFAKKHNVSFLFIPNCTYKFGNKWQDDRKVHLEIKKRLNRKTNSYLINKQLDVFETINIFSILDMHITNRRHSFVFAALQNVHSIIFNDHSGSMPNHQLPVAKDLKMKQQVLSLNLNLNMLINKISFNWENRMSYKKKLSINSKKLITKAKKHVPYLINI